MNILFNTQNINELLDWNTSFIYLIFGISIAFAISLIVMHCFGANKKSLSIIFYITLISVAITVFTSILSVSTVSSKHQQLKTIVSERLHAKYDFEDFNVKENNQSFFGKKVFENDKVDAPEVTVVLNGDEGIVNWRVTGNADTGEVEFIGDGNVNPDEILKESE